MQLQPKMPSNHIPLRVLVYQVSARVLALQTVWGLGETSEKTGGSTHLARLRMLWRALDTGRCAGPSRPGRAAPATFFLLRFELQMV